MKLTGEAYWDDFWDVQVPVVVDYGFQNDRVIARAIKEIVPVADYDRQVLEVGCAPGKWLVFLNRELHYLVDGCDYSRVGVAKTLDNLFHCGVASSQRQVIMCDFTNTAILHLYDVVYSLGFLEHFDNPIAILEHQLTLVKPGGILLVGVPNFRGINWALQRCIDYFVDDSLLTKHNLRVMDKRFYEQFAAEHVIEIIHNKYAGGFETALFTADKIHNKLVRVFFCQLIRVTRFLLGWCHNKYVSGYLIAAFKKQEGANENG
jgi:2-polyprenyl-3-methyl-5-hydroxy-6-metoxy-1,4-benzoquinol methylase